MTGSVKKPLEENTRRSDADDPERILLMEHRIESKLRDYASYDFPMHQVRALNIFFDLAQEVRGREMFYAVCMAIPRVLLGLESSIHILEDEDTFVLAGCSKNKCDREATQTWSDTFTNKPVLSGEHLFIPIQSNPKYNDMLPFEPPHNILGVFELHPCSTLSEHERLFLEKYVNRIGFQLHHRIIRARNREHIGFIKSMVQDIGHNVIVPNMYFKLYFHRLKRQIEQLHLTTSGILALMNECGRPDCTAEGNRLARITAGIEAQYQEIYSHYESTSMFLETLLRRRHFEEGRYVLDKHEVNLTQGVIIPLLERFRQRFEEHQIELNFSLGGAPDQNIRLIMDRGLISQVIDNLFANALKYTEEVTLSDGRYGKFVSYGWQVFKDYFAPGKPGIRLWVTSTGKPLALKNPIEVFKPGFRADNVTNQSGTGRGLYFVRQVVELHGGQVGYSHTDNSNEFYFILPFEQK